MILDKIIANKEKEVAKRKINLPLGEIKEKMGVEAQKGCTQKTLSLREAVSESKISLIAEVKKASPSKGVFKKDFDPVETARTYEKAGAKAVSVLTDSRYFKGSLEDLKKVKNNVKLPVIRKDFIIDSYQLYESKYMGADAVLLIAGILAEKELKRLISLAEALGLEVLTETHNREEVAKALQCGSCIIGINNRDLQTFETDISVTLKLAPYIPDDCLIVSESGIFSGEHVRKLEEAGVDALLIGESLMTSSDIYSKVQELFGR